LGLALGNLPVNLEQAVFAYGSLANDGQLNDLVWFRGQPHSGTRRIFSEETARLITLYLSDPMARLPSFPRMGTTEYPFPVAIKTGTSKGFRDAWAIAYSKDYLIGVWVGRADNKPMNRLGGAGSAAQLAQEIIMHLHPQQADGLHDLAFSPPEGYVPVEICAYTGLKAGGQCEHTLMEWFPENRQPKEDNLHQVLIIDSRNDLLATPWTPKDQRKTASFLTLPPQYAAWQKEEKIPTPPQAYSPLDIPPGFSLENPVKAAGLTHIDPVDISIHSPADGLQILRNPEAPEAMNSLSLNATVSTEVPQLLWYVDGQPYKLAEAPYSVRWPLKAGTHSFQARLPFRDEVSDIVKVTVQ
jgi:penicillin-binding protein 1C